LQLRTSLSGLKPVPTLEVPADPCGWQASAWSPPGQAEFSQVPSFLPGGASEVGGDDVGRVPVQTATGAVVSDGGTRVGVRGGFLHISQRHPSVQGRRDERVPQRMPAP